MKSWLLVGLSLLCHSVLAFQTIDDSVYFPRVAQGHHGDRNNSCYQISGSQLTMYNQAKILGTDGLNLSFCSQNVGSMPSDGCDTASGGSRACTVTGADLRGLSITGDNAFPSRYWVAGGIPYCNYGQSFILGSGIWSDFDSISLYNACTLTFSTNHSEYWVNSLSIGWGATVILPAGDYYFRDLTINEGGVLVPQGKVRIFVQNSPTFNNASVNPGNTGDLLIFSYSDINLNGTSVLNSYVYADDRLKLNTAAQINGRVTARYLEMNGTSTINDTNRTPTLTCFSDPFSATSLDSNWVVASSSGGFLPKIINGRMRLTEAKTYQATSVTYQRLFPAAGNLVTIEFDQAAYGGSAADGIAMVLSDAAVTPQPGSSGGPLGYGYKTGVPGFAGGWLGIGIDEYGNFSAEGGSNSPGTRKNSVAIRGSGSGTSGYRYLYGTGTLSPTIHSGTSYPNPAHRYRLTVDSRLAGQALVTIQRNTGSGYTTLIPTFNAIGQTGQAAVPEDFYLSFTGSTGASTNIHELDNVQICALNSSPVGTQVDHFEFSHSGQGLTCNPEQMTIRACADASCSTLVTESVTAVLSPASLSDGGWVGGNSVTFSGGSATVSLRKTTAGEVTIGVTSSTPSSKPFSKTLCQAGGGALSEQNCTLSFADSGFVLDVPNIIANKAATNVIVKAVKKDDSTKQCVPGFASTSKTVSFWSDYIDPLAAGRPVSRPVSVNGTAIGLTSATATPLTLAFDAQGQATLASVNYTDAGKLQLNARYTGSAATGDASLVMSGSDQFVSRPVGLCIRPETSCPAGNGSCPYFRRAGENFSVSLTAQAWESDSDSDLCSGNLTTPNFALSGIALGSTLLAPSGGVSAAMGTASYNHGASSSAQQTITQSLSEVGVFRLTATPPSYLGTTIPPSSSAPVGRITPYDFALSNASTTPGCGSFSYMDQPMPTSFTLAARNRTGGTTANYRDEFAPGQVALVAENGDDGVALSSRLSGLGGLGWQAGLFTANQYPATFGRNLSPDGPFSQLAIGVSVADNEKDVVIPLIGTNMNAATAGDCGSNCDAVRLGGQDLRHGRLKPATGRTFASNPLALPLTIESYAAGQWQRSLADQCTTLDLTVNGGFLFDRDYDPGKAELTLLDHASKSRLALTQDPAAPAGQPTSSKAKDGYIWLHFTAPGISDRVHYRLDLARQPLAPIWLNYDWDHNGVADVDDLSGWAFFNQWRSSDRVIYRRELLQ